MVQHFLKFNFKIVAVTLDFFAHYSIQVFYCIETDTDDVSAVEVMRKLCLKVKEMEEQRVNLIAELRTQLEQDDVTSTLMTRPGVDAEVRMLNI